MSPCAVAKASPSRRSPSYLANAALVAVSVVFAVALLEGALRVYWWAKYGTTEAFVGGQFEFDEELRLRLPVPGTRTKTIEINSLGFRGPELETPKAAGTLRLAFLGGSTTYCTEVSGNDRTWPHLVWEALSSRYPERAIDYINAAVPGYTTRHSLRRLRHQVEPLSPDVVLIYHATNDLAAITREFASAEGIYSDDPERSWLDKNLLVWRYATLKLELILASSARSSGEKPRLEYDGTELEKRFEEELSRLVTAAREVAPVVVLITFAHRLRPEALTGEELRAASGIALQNMPYMSIPGLVAGYRHLNSVIRDVARRSGVMLIDVESLIPPTEEYFTDSFHFSDRGSAEMAKLVSEVLLGSPELQRLMSARGE